jgi:hypothetical protein
MRREYRRFMMPMEPGKDQKTISKNIREFHSGETYQKTKKKYGKKKADKQAVAASLENARRSKK